MKTRISVTHSIYGAFDERRLLMSIATLKSIDRVNEESIEIIVAEQNDIPQFADHAEQLGVKYDFSTPPTIEGSPVYLPGAIRNNALRLATGEYIYTNDADVIFPNKNFFRDLVDLIGTRRDVTLQRPPMIRLLKDCFDEFYATAQHEDIERAICALHKVTDYTVATRPLATNLRVHERRGTIFTINNDDYERYMKTPSLKGQEPTMWHATVHCGGTFARAEHIAHVGGYSSIYKTWGFEDSDIQWKLSQVFTMEQIPREKRYLVMHLDHPKGYYDKSAAKRNEELFTARQNGDVREAIAEDMMRFKKAQEGTRCLSSNG